MLLHGFMIQSLFPQEMATSPQLASVSVILCVGTVEYVLPMGWNTVVLPLSREI